MAATAVPAHRTPSDSSPAPREGPEYLWMKNEHWRSPSWLGTRSPSLSPPESAEEQSIGVLVTTPKAPHPLGVPRRMGNPAPRALWQDLSLGLSPTPPHRPLSEPP